MSGEIEDEDEIGEKDEKPGFFIRLPFHIGWLRGNGDHLATLMPSIRIIIVSATAIYLLGRIVEGLHE